MFDERAAVVVCYQSSVVSNMDIVNPSLVHRPHVVWSIQRFDSQLTDVTLHLLSRLTARKKVDLRVNFNVGETYATAFFNKKRPKCIASVRLTAELYWRLV